MFRTILEALQQKFSGVDAKMLEPIARKLAKDTAKAEDVAAAVEAVTQQQVIESYSDFRVNQAVTTTSANAISEYEKRYGLKDGEKIDAGGTPKNKPTENKPAEEEPEWAKNIRLQNEAILKRYEQEEETSKQTGFHTSLTAILEEKGVRKSFYAPIINGRSFKDEDDVKAFAETVEQSYKDDEQAVANLRHSGKGKPDVGDDGGDDDMDALLKSAEENTEQMRKK